MKSGFLLLSIVFLLSACSNGNKKNSNNNVLNLDKTKKVKIGTQTWMAENLNVSTFRNGDPILQAKTDEEWEKAGKNKQPAWCYYDNDPENGSKYGKLYNWFAVNDPRGLAPKGWHVPSNHEWGILSAFLGGREIAGRKMKSSNGWQTIEINREKYYGNGSNESGFTGYPGGIRSGAYYENKFNGIGVYGSWWSSSLDDIQLVFCRSLILKFDYIWVHTEGKSLGQSVRCIKD